MEKRITGKMGSAGNSRDVPQGEPLLMVAARGGVFGFVGSIGARVLGLILQIMVSRLYGPHYYGLFVTGLIFCLIMEMISGLGLQKGSMRFLAIAHEKCNFQSMPDIFRTALIFPLVAGTLIAIISYIAAPFVADVCFKDPELENVLRQFSFAVPFMALMRISSDLSRAFKVMKYTVIIEDLLFSVLQIFIFVYLHSLGYGFLSVVRSFTLSAIFCSLLMIVIVWRLIWRHLENLDVHRSSFRRGILPKDWRVILVYSLPLMPMGLLLIGDQFTDIIMLGILAGPESVGEYAAAARWVTLFIIIARPIYMVFTPMMAGQFGMNHTDQIVLLYNAAIRWTFFLTLPVFVFLLLAREQLMLLFGRGFVQSGPTVLAVLLLGNLLTTLVGNAGNLLTVSGHQYKELGCIAGSLALNLLLNLWLIPTYGVYGAAISTVMSNVVCDVSRLIIVRQYFGMYPFAGCYVAPLISSLILCIGATLVSSVFNVGSIERLGLALGAGCLVAMSIVTLGLDSVDREIFSMLRGKLFKREAFNHGQY